MFGGGKTIDGDGLSLRLDRKHKIRIRRRVDAQGFESYMIENVQSKEVIEVRRFLFDRFRSALRGIVVEDQNSGASGRIDEKIVYKQEPRFHIQTDRDDLSVVLIHEMTLGTKSTGLMRIDRKALPPLLGLLFDDRLGHPNDLLNRIISYHKLFRFSFVDGSESITSNLSLRKDVLAETDDYVPAIGRRVGSSSEQQLDKNLLDGENPVPRKGKDPKSFKSKLGMRDGRSDYKVDYDSLFSGPATPSGPAPKASKASGRTSRHCFPLPVLAQEIKSFQQVPFACELSTEESSDLREKFLADRNSELYIGFEICDAIFRGNGGKLKTYRFPLYYLPVRLRESGRTVFVEPNTDKRVFLNHLALANLVDSFGKAKAGLDPVAQFFETLLAQSISVNGQMGRIYLSRILPFDDDIYERTREVLLGFGHEKGKGGLLSELNVVGIECDLESVALYKAAKTAAPLAAALDKDLDTILQRAHEKPSEFSDSLLGRFLASDGRTSLEVREKLFRKNWIPGALSKPMRRLVQNCNDHDLLMLEGPPGTGKTFAIMNLFIQSVCSGKRLLVVSDQPAGIQALYEKLIGYLVQGKDGPEAEALTKLWNASIGVIEDLPSVDQGLGDWANQLKKNLHLDSVDPGGWYEPSPDAPDTREIDARMAKLRKLIEIKLSERIGPKSDLRRRVSPKRLHATTLSDIDEMVSFLRFLGSGSLDRLEKREQNMAARSFVAKFIQDREYLINTSKLEYYRLIRIPRKVETDHLDQLRRMIDLLTRVRKKRPRSLEKYLQIARKDQDLLFSSLLAQEVSEAFPPDDGGIAQAGKFMGSLISYPLRTFFQDLARILYHHKRLFELYEKIEPGVWRQLRIIHEALAPDAKNAIPLSLEVCRFTNDCLQQDRKGTQRSVQELLEELDALQDERDQMVREQFIQRLVVMAKNFTTAEDGQTSKATRLAALLDSLKSHSSIESAGGMIDDMRQTALKSFPVWICRKQAVSFLFPCVKDLFDLVVVDEATQCRVDDALPLLYRGRKLLVVGDDRQTVLARNSVLDDYLFSEFNLNEHLRTNQAHGIKGGGSHLFALMKGVKQASIMLDEHYRCPPEIIEFSNRYVYGDQLRTMQWVPRNSKSSVTVDYSERKATTGGRATSGKFKGIETKMVDRFFKYVEKTILEIEKETGQPVSLEADVAICYFLLKNEPYVKSIKTNFLNRLGRGRDVLDGAGAALQGKERDYIFYLWDCTRSNFQAFKQGDDEDKRRGELNVLMSRPKKRAYHYLHKDFDKLNHGGATITDYLWRTWQRQQSKEESKEEMPRQQKPTTAFIPWRRYSGQLMKAILSRVMRDRNARQAIDLRRFVVDYSIAVGDPRYRVDLMLTPKKAGPSVAVVDLCGFEGRQNLGEEVIDFYFQLKRATPKIRPVFLFLHELAIEHARGYQCLEEALLKSVA